MGPNTAELATLRALTFRLSSTTTAQLPQHVPAIAASLANCRSLLSSTQTSASKSSPEASVAIHKYRTLLSTLLQDRTVQGRWAAIVLIKSTIEVGGWETLQKSLPWVRGLLGILTRPDPPSSKNLCLITLTRIFVFTRQYPTLLREITTPSLPAFIQSCLQLAASKASASLLQAILESFNQLLPRHPTIFRSYLKQLQQLLRQTIAPTPSSKLSREQSQEPKSQISSGVAEAARRLFVQLPCCAPKGGSYEEWENEFKSTIDNAHRVADKVFRAVVEDWQSPLRGPPAMAGQTLDDEVQDLETNGMSLPPWSGIYAGSERLVGLLRLVKEYLANNTASVVTLHIAIIMDLFTRILSLTVPSNTLAKTFQDTAKFNNQVTKEERENLWLVLPQVHVAAIEILLALTYRCEDSMSALSSLVLDQLIWLFNSEKDTAQIRTACYLAMAQLLVRSGATLPKSSIDQLSSMIRTCCDDLFPLDLAAVTSNKISAQNKANGTTQQQASMNADAFVKSSPSSTDLTTDFSGLKQAAYDLLPAILTGIPAQYFSDSLRARMDRTAILTQHKDAMVASVLNPPPSKKFGKPAASILPLVARSFADKKDLEGLLRPRIPVIRSGTQKSNGGDDVEEDTEEEDDHFVGEELDTLLETAAQTEHLVGSSATTDSSAPNSDSARHTPSSFAATPTNIINNEQNSIVPVLGQLISGSKRPQGEDTPLSPTKRVKVGTEEEVPHEKPATVLTTFTTQLSKLSGASAIVPIQPPLPQLPVVTAPVVGEGDSDDDDDIVPLVFGQDTDEESDS